MSGETVGWMMSKSGMGPVAKLALWYFADAHYPYEWEDYEKTGRRGWGPDLSCDESVVAKWCEVDVPELHEALKTLISMGLITVGRRTDDGKGFHYTVEYRPKNYTEPEQKDWLHGE